MHLFISPSIETTAFLDLSYPLEKEIPQKCNKFAD